MWVPWNYSIDVYGYEPLTRAAYSDPLDKGDRFIVRTEVPGIPRDKIDVSVTEDEIEISGEAKVGQNEDEKD